jgi:hypothetical protein
VNGHPKDIPVSERDLVGAVRFVDGFTGQPIGLQFSVSIPSPAGTWAATWASSDATYRFSQANPKIVRDAPQLATGTFDLNVTTLDGVNLYVQPPAATPPGPYVLTNQPEVTFPIAASHPPPVLATDYLTELSMWPTPAFSVPVGETAVSGWVVSASGGNVSALRLKLLQANEGPAGEPWATTDGAGQFVIRLPSVKLPPGLDPTLTLNVEMVDQHNNPITVAPSTLTVQVGTVTKFTRLLIP